MHTAMLQAILPQAVFIPTKCQVKVPVSLQSVYLHINLQALLDSGTTDNFISPLTVNHFKLSTYKLPKSKVICNVDRTKNSQGSIMHTVNLEVQYNGQGQASTHPSWQVMLDPHSGIVYKLL